MRKTDADARTARDNRESGEAPTRVATDEEVRRAADRAIERNREALTELAKW